MLTRTLERALAEARKRGCDDDDFCIVIRLSHEWDGVMPKGRTVFVQPGGRLAEYTVADVLKALGILDEARAFGRGHLLVLEGGRP